MALMSIEGMSQIRCVSVRNRAEVCDRDTCEPLELAGTVSPTPLNTGDFAFLHCTFYIYSIYNWLLKGPLKTACAEKISFLQTI